MAGGSLSGVTTTSSWVGLEWAFPGVVVSIVMPFSISVRDALELLISDVVVSIGCLLYTSPSPRD